MIQVQMSSREMKHLFSCDLRIKYINVLIRRKKVVLANIVCFLSAKLYHETEHPIYTLFTYLRFTLIIVPNTLYCGLKFKSSLN